jgi:hypothetical protein
MRDRHAGADRREESSVDSKRFDAFVQEVSAAATRRRMLGGILGGAALLTGAVAGGGDGLAKRGKSKGKKKKRGKGKNSGNGNGNGNGKGKGRTKVFICHKGKVLHVASPSLKGHLGHGDFECGEAPECQTGSPTGCDQETETCTFEPVDEGTPCTTDDGAEGTCDAAGVCVATPVCGEAGAACELDEDCCEDLTCQSLICAAV